MQLITHSGFVRLSVHLPFLLSRSLDVNFQQGYFGIALFHVLLTAPSLDVRLHSF